MPEPAKPSTSNRIILVIMIALAAFLIGATIIATMNEWTVMDAEPGVEEPVPATVEN